MMLNTSIKHWSEDLIDHSSNIHFYDHLNYFCSYQITIISIHIIIKFFVNGSKLFLNE